MERKGNLNKMILIIDNYDSFTYNLVQYLGELFATKDEKLRTFRNDRIDVGEIKRMRPSHIVISPGPGRPEDAGISCKVIEEFSGLIPILGVCLGHQCIGKVFGGQIVKAERLMHGKTSFIYHNGETILKGIDNPFIATRYHSLIVKKETLPKDILEVIAWTKEGEIMGLRHRRYPTWGLQFHPESILTKVGKKILKNFIDVK